MTDDIEPPATGILGQPVRDCGQLTISLISQSIRIRIEGDVRGQGHSHVLVPGQGAGRLVHSPSERLDGHWIRSTGIEGKTSDGLIHRRQINPGVRRTLPIDHRHRNEPGHGHEHRHPIRIINRTERHIHRIRLTRG